MTPIPAEAGMEDARLIAGLREPYTDPEGMFQPALDVINAERRKAADRLAVLSEENERLREVLQHIADGKCCFPGPNAWEFANDALTHTQSQQRG